MNRLFLRASIISCNSLSLSLSHHSTLREICLCYFNNFTFWTTAEGFFRFYIIMDLIGPKRMQRELVEMMEMKDFAQVQLLHPDFKNGNIFRWFAILMPTQPPYNKGSYRLEIDFPERYPFKPPLLHIRTKVYHPNINDRGQLCIPILETENWKPTSRMFTILNVVLATFNDPQTDSPFNVEMANLYISDRKKYDKLAEAWVLRYADKRYTERQLVKMKRKLLKALEK